MHTRLSLDLCLSFRKESKNKNNSMRVQTTTNPYTISNSNINLFIVYINTFNKKHFLYKLSNFFTNTNRKIYYVQYKPTTHTHTQNKMCIETPSYCISSLTVDKNVRRLPTKTRKSCTKLCM